MIKNLKKERGTILVAVLILLVVAIIGGVAFLQFSKTGSKITGALSRQSNVSECNDSALNVMMLNINALTTLPASTGVITRPDDANITELRCPQCENDGCPDFLSYYNTINWTEYKTAVKTANLSANNNNASIVEEIADYLESKCKIAFRTGKVNEESCSVALNSIERHPQSPQVYSFAITSSSRSKAVAETIKATMSVKPPQFAWLSDYPIIIGPDLHMMKTSDLFKVYMQGRLHSNAYLMFGLKQPTSGYSYIKFYNPSTFPGLVGSSVGPIMQFFKMYNTSRDTGIMTIFNWDNIDEIGDIRYYESDTGYSKYLKHYPDKTSSEDFIVPESELNDCDVALASADRCWKQTMDGNPFKNGLGYWGRVIEEDNPVFKGKLAAGIDPIVPKAYQAFKDAGVDPRLRIEPMSPSDDAFLRANKLVYKAECIIIDGIAVDINGSPIIEDNDCKRMSTDSEVIQPKQDNVFYYAPAGQMVSSYDVAVRKLTEKYPRIKKIFIGSSNPVSGEIRYPTPSMDVSKYLDDGTSTPAPLFNALCINESGGDCSSSPATMGTMDAVTLTGGYPVGGVEITTNLVSILKGSFNNEYDNPKTILLHSDSTLLLSGQFTSDSWVPDGSGNITGVPNEVNDHYYYTLVLDTSQILPTIERYTDAAVQKLRGTQLNFFQSKYFPPRRSSKSVNDWLARSIRNLHTAGQMWHIYKEIFKGALPEDLNIPGGTEIRLLSVERTN